MYKCITIKKLNNTMPKLCVYKVSKVFLLKVVRKGFFLFGHYSVTWAYGLNLDVHCSVLWALKAK